MKGPHFYDDVNDVAWESKKACESSSLSIYCTWLDCCKKRSLYAVLLNIYTSLSLFADDVSTEFECNLNH